MDNFKVATEENGTWNRRVYRANSDLNTMRIAAVCFASVVFLALAAIFVQLQKTKVVEDTRAPMPARLYETVNADYETIKTVCFYYVVPVHIVVELVGYSNPELKRENYMGLSPEYQRYFVDKYALTSTDLTDVRVNLQAGVGYLAELYARYKDWSSAVQAWLVGPSAYDAGRVPQEVRDFALSLD